MRDRNGNTLSLVYDAFNRIATITDSLNRQVTISYQVSDAAPYGLSDQITYKGFGGATRTIRVSYANLNSALRPNSGFAISTFKQLFPELNGSSTGTYNPVVVSAVWLPDGSRRYGLFYDSYGELARVELPTGGAIEYDAAPGSGAVTDGFDFHILRRVAVRRLYPDGVTLEGTTTYSPSSVTDTTVVEDHRDAGGSLLARVKHSYFGNPEQSLFQEAVDYPAWKHGREFQTEALSVDGVTVLSRQTQTWQQRAAVGWWNPSFPDLAPPNDPRISESATTLADTNQVSKQSFSYDQFNNKTDVSEFDYGAGAAGPLARRTHTDYLAINPLNGADYTDPAIHLRGLPAQQSVFDASGIERARTTFEYDNYAADGSHALLLDRFGISGLDGGFNTFYLTRGNVTGVSRWILSTGASLNAYSQYDIAGNVVKTIDPRGFATTIDFSDRFGTPNGEARSNSAPAELAGQVSYAFPTQVTNALGQSVFAQFDYSLGRPVDAEDANGTVASGSYNDLLDRPTQIVRGANTSLASQTTFSYNDASRIVTTTSDLSSDGDNQLKNEVVFDGLGRQTETRSYESSFAYVVTQQFYDGLGRVRQASNPFRPASDSPQWTTTQYDVLSRVATVTTPDGAVVSTSYVGNQATVTDQAGKARRSVTDGLGRLMQVIEDPFGLAYSTSYSYDVLDDLTTVSQGVQTRSFVYDSLKRLTSATNPESGTISYGYDGNGNLTAKTDARGVTTSFSYDPLNRVTSKSYSDVTPSVSYFYDASQPASVPVGYNRGTSTGRLTAVTSAAATNFYGYDALGRVSQSFQRTDGVDYGFSYAYNLVGALTSTTYPSGRVVSHSYDSAGRIASVSGIKGAASTTYASSFAYAPHGAIQSLTLGNGLIESTAFNNRLQPTNISLGSLLSLAYNYGLTNNNGNVLSMTITPGTGQTPISQAFTYDALNRLLSGTETVSGSQTWKQTNGFDQYGNRWIDSLNTTGNVMGPISSQTDIGASNNRIVKAGYSYDAAGNMTAEPGKSYIFDGENKIVSALVGSSTSNYVYDGEGRRVKKVTPSGTIVMVYDASSRLVAEYADTVSAGPGGTQYATADHLGTPRLWTNASGAVVPNGRHDYLPFGEELFSGMGSRSVALSYPLSAQTDGQRNQFTLKERDNETNLDYFLARYYGSALGRFTSPDETLIDQWTADPQSWNLYEYVRNNSLNRVDPDGKDVRICADNGDGSQNCFDVTDQEYSKLFDAQNGKQGITLPGGKNPSGNIMCGDQVCGTVRPVYSPGAAALGGFLLGLTGPSVAISDLIGVESANTRMFRNAVNDHPIIGFLGEQAGALLLGGVVGRLVSRTLTNDFTTLGVNGRPGQVTVNVAHGARGGRTAHIGTDAEIESAIKADLHANPPTSTGPQADRTINVNGKPLTYRPHVDPETGNIRVGTFFDPTRGSE